MTQYHAIGEIVDSRYRIVAHLGQGSSGITYAATALTTERLVALKVLTLRGLDDWKKLELFEREANVLATLNHPGIPAYVDYFQVDTPSDRAFYIVQTLAEGKSLAALVAEGWRTDETGVKQIAFKVLTILDYLHNLNPPIIHRDIKPQNIIRRDDGEISLVDFGAVQQVYRDTMSYGSTVVGTYGYMSPEQFQGQAFPGSDLYGLGTTILFLLTHRPPAELPRRRLKLQFRQAVTVSDDFASWLDGLLEPLIEDRLVSAQAAIAALRQPHTALIHSTGAIATRPLKKPAGSRIHLDYNRNHLQLDIPPNGLRGEALGLAGFVVLWSCFIFFWIILAATTEAPLIFLVFSIPFWIVGLGMKIYLINGVLEHIRLNISHRAIFRLERQILGWRRVVIGNATDLIGAELRISHTQNNRPTRSCALLEGVRTHKFGTILTQPEKAWLVQELDAFIQHINR